MVYFIYNIRKMLNQISITTPLSSFWKMAANDSNVSTVGDSKSLHPIYSVANIQNEIPTLDDVKVTYSSWVKLFKLHAFGYDVL